MLRVEHLHISLASSASTVHHAGDIFNNEYWAKLTYSQPQNNPLFPSGKKMPEASILEEDQMVSMSKVNQLSPLKCCLQNIQETDVKQNSTI